MADFFKCCFPGFNNASNDDGIEFVSAVALTSTRQHHHRAQHPDTTMVPAHTHSSHRRPDRRRPSEDLQHIIDNEAQQDDINDVSFNALDRAHAHLLRDLDSSLAHFRYAVSGSYAEALWGCQRGKRRNTVSIMCQSSFRKTIRVWLYSQTLFTVSANDENVLEYQGDVRGAAPLSVRIRWVSDRELQRLRIIESKMRYREGPVEPVIDVRLVLLTLPALADNIAWSYINARDRRAREDFAADLFSILQRIVDLGFIHEGTGPLTAEENVHMLSKEFWIPFTEAYPHALELFVRCGALVPEFAVIASPPQFELNMQTQPSALGPNSFQNPGLTPLTPLDQRQRRRHRTNSSPMKQEISSKHNKSSSSSNTKRSSAKSKANTQHLSPQSSPQRPVHPANIIQSQREPRSKFSALLGLKESPETLERRRQEKLENDRAARRASENLAAKIQRNRERDREREWHTRKQSERMSLQEPEKNPMFMSQSHIPGNAEAGPSRTRL